MNKKILVLSSLAALFWVWVVVPTPLVFIQKAGKVQFVDADTLKPISGVIVNFVWSATWSSGLVDHPYYIKRLNVVSDSDGYIEIPGFRYWLPWRPFFTFSKQTPSFNLTKALYAPSKKYEYLQPRIVKYPYFWVHHADLGHGSSGTFYLEQPQSLDKKTYWRYARTMHLVMGDITTHCDNPKRWVYVVERDILEQYFLSAGVLDSDWLNNIPESWHDDCGAMVSYLLDLRAERKRKDRTCTIKR